MQRMPGAELTEHLGYEHGREPPIVPTNRRNGVGRKTVKYWDGAFEIEAPRDRKGSLEPRPIAKGRTRIDGFDEKIIATDARGEPCPPSAVTSGSPAGSRSRRT